MKYKIKYFLPVVVATIMACTQDEKVADTAAPIFPKGDKNTNDNFVGEVWVKSLVDADSLNETAVGNVTFTPGARSKWHSHPAGQIILATEGVGYYQEKGKSKMILRKGDVVKCPPNLPHWHGASADSAFVQLAITGRQKGPTVWLESVPDSVYLAK
jgi:quercetin dioxygenase-like cupin family protein